MGTKRIVSPADKAKFFAGISAGKTIGDASRNAGIHINTGSKWLAKAKALQAAHDLETLKGRKAVASEGGQQRDTYNAFMEAIEMPSAIPFDKLGENALRGLQDFRFFREHYLGRVPSPWQVEAGVKIIEWLESDEKEFVVMNVPPGAGKALALWTPLKTPTGWTTIGEVRPGDYVIGAKGQPVMVQAKSEVFTDHDCYTVTSDDGFSVVADADHLWPVRLHGEGKYKYTGRPDSEGKSGTKTRGKDGIRTQTTEMLSRPRAKRPELQMTAPVYGSHDDLPIPPYTLGVWLGDGASAGGRISCHQDDMPYTKSQIENDGYQTTTPKHPQTFTVRGLSKQLRKLGLLNNKHVPDQYLNASHGSRLALLQGLIDSDGHVSPSGSIEFCNTNINLALSVRYLAVSLGVKCSMSTGRALLYGKDCGPKYRVSFMLKGAARLPRKLVNTRDGIRTPNRYLTTTLTDSEQTQCIQVEGGLYLAGEGLMVTHNSTLFHDVAVWAICRKRDIRIMIGSVSQNMAKLYSRRIRETLERPMPFLPDPMLVQKGLAKDAEGCLSIDYGRFRPTDKGALWRADEFVVEQIGGNGLDNKEPTVRAYGIESEFIGHRADLCLFDDVASPDNARESVSRDKLLERWDGVAEARCDPGGLLCVIGQRLGAGDLYAHCLAKVSYDDLDEDYDGSDITSPEQMEAMEPIKSFKYRHIVYQAYYPELDTGKESRRFDSPPYPDGPLLDPKRLPWKDLSFIRHSKPDVFRVVYQQEELDVDGYLISKVWVYGGQGDDGVTYPGCIDDHRNHGQIPAGLAPPVLSVVSIDPSPTKFWALTWMLYQPELNLFHVVDIERCKLTAEELLGFNTTTSEYSGIMDEWQERSLRMGFPISHWIVEINAAQRFLLQHDFVRKWASRNMTLILPHTTSRNKLDEKLGVEALLPQLFRSGNIRLPNNRITWKTMAAVSELTTWTTEKKNGTDIVMSIWMAVLNIPNLSVSKAPPRQWRPSWLNA